MIGEHSVAQIERIKLSFPASRRYVGLVGAVVQELCQLVPGVPSSTRYNIQLAVDEATINVITHAYGEDPGGIVDMTFEVWADRLVIQIRDWGQSFDPSTIPEPPPDQPHSRGRGISLMRRLMDQVIYEQGTQEGNCVTLIKRIA